MTQQENYNVCRSLKKSRVQSKSVRYTVYAVPYNIDFELYVLSKQSDDALQIVEQILPYFQPRLYSNYQ